MEKSNCRNDVDFLNEIHFRLENNEECNSEKFRIKAYGQKYNPHVGNKTLVKNELIPFNFPDDENQSILCYC